MVLAQLEVDKTGRWRCKVNQNVKIVDDRLKIRHRRDACGLTQRADADVLGQR